MADYKTLHGSNIEVVASDPSNPVSGQVWYNTTSNVMKGFTSNATGAWATGGTMNTARGGFPGGLGIQTAAICFGGENPSDYQIVNESYNGTTWTEVGDLSTKRNQIGSAGASSTAGLAIAGLNTVQPDYNLKVVESWNGTSWTEVGDLNQERYGPRGAGTATAALAFTGNIFPSGSPAGPSALTETWNGTAWTEVGDLNTTRAGGGGIGATNTAALCAGGKTTEYLAVVESWNGTAWTEVADLNLARNECGASGSSNTLGLIFGGRVPGYKDETEFWNGTAWTEVADLNTAVGSQGSAKTGTQSATASFGGNRPAVTAVSEEWNEPVTATVTFDASDV